MNCSNGKIPNANLCLSKIDGERPSQECRPADPRCKDKRQKTLRVEHILIHSGDAILYVWSAHEISNCGSV